MFRLKSFHIILTIGSIFISCDFQVQNATRTFVNEPPIQLKTGPWPKSDPAWSPDGSMIAYSVTRRATNLINTSLNDEELNKIGRVEDNIRDGKFDLSPDGTKIVYFSIIKRHLRILDLQDGSESSLTADHPFAREPVWSPDGKWIAFSASSRSSESRSIWVIPLSGGNAKEVTNSDGRDVHPSWSPDGEKIAYESNRNGGVSIWIINLNRSEVLQLTPDSTFDRGPDWSPDGSTIAYYSRRNDSTAIWTIPARGGKETKLINVEKAANPAWSPDGTKIAYRTSQGIWISSVDGAILHKTSIKENYPVWWPDGNSLVSTRGIEYSIIEVFSLDDSLSKAVTEAIDFQHDKHPTWYPDSKTMAFVRGKTLPAPSQTIWTTSYPEGEATPLISDSTYTVFEHHPAVSPDGNWLVYNERYAMLLLPLFGGELINLSQYVGIFLVEPAWAPDSKAIVCRYFTRRASRLKIISIDSGHVVEQRGIPGNYANPAWSVRHPVFGSHIAAESPSGIYIMSPEGASAEFVIFAGEDPSWSPDGTSLAYINNAQLYILHIFISLPN
jgi:Tol biopolymer transport system component